MIYETAGQLEEACREWQAILRLQDWDITAEIVRGKQMVERDDSGNVRWNDKHRIARISILDPVDHEGPEFVGELDHEETLVHELLHLHFAGLDHEDETTFELAINRISEALVKLKRRFP